MGSQVPDIRSLDHAGNGSAGRDQCSLALSHPSSTEAAELQLCTYNGPGAVSARNYYATSSTGGFLNPDGFGAASKTYRVGFICSGEVSLTAAVDNFVVMRARGSNRRRWTTDWESNTASSDMRRVTSNAEVNIVANVSTHEADANQALDPSGFVSDYLRVEQQSGGARDLNSGPQSVRQPFTPVTAEPISYDPTEAQSTLESIPAPTTHGPESIGMYYLAMVCPDSFATTAQQHANLWMSKIHSGVRVDHPYPGSSWPERRPDRCTKGLRQLHPPDWGTLVIAHAALHLHMTPRSQKTRN